MRLLRIGFVVAVLAAAGIGLSAGRATAGTISGTLTVGDGSGLVPGGAVPIHAPASSTVPMATIEMWVNGSSVTGGPIVYTDELSWTFFGNLDWRIQVQWCDEDAACLLSDEVNVTSDGTPPSWGFQTAYDDNPPAGTATIGFWAADVSPIAQARFSPDNVTWGAPVPAVPDGDAWRASYPLFDPVYGGSSRLGSRTLWMQVSDQLGNWADAQSRTIEATLRTTIDVSPARPVTGHLATFTPSAPVALSYPAGTYCMWEFMWGDPQSLYYGNRDETFGFFHTYGPKSGGYCNPRSFTMPWMPYPRMLVHFEAYGPDGETIAEASIGQSPKVPAVIPVIESTSRRITASNVPMVYVLPDDYILELGQPTTYRAYSLGGAPLGGGDWSADFTGDANDRFKSGGTSFTFTPHTTGFVTVCWNSDTTRSTRWSACYDPPVKRKDIYRPNTSKPVQLITSTTIGGTSVPVTLTWSGSDRGWGIAKYQLDRSIDGGAWKRVVSSKVKTYAASLASGHAYRFRVRAIDKYGNVGDWDYGSTLRPSIAEDTSAAIHYADDWATGADAAARGGSVHESSTPASEVRYTFSGRDVAWLAARGPGHGRATVYIDNVRIVTVDLEASASAPSRVVLRKHWTARATHTVRIVVEGTSGRPLVDVDGFAILR